MVDDRLGGPEDLDAVNPRAVLCGVVVEQAAHLPPGRCAVDGADKLERLAREPARTDQQERPQGESPPTSVGSERASRNSPRPGAATPGSSRARTARPGGRASWPRPRAAWRASGSRSPPT